jgi:hypothetical protein
MPTYDCGLSEAIRIVGDFVWIKPARKKGGHFANEICELLYFDEPIEAAASAFRLR